MKKTIKKIIKLLSLIALISIMIVGCANKSENNKLTEDNKVTDEIKQPEDDKVTDDTKEIDQLKVPATGDQVAIFKTNHGDIKVKLLPENAPKAVENFTTHAKNGYYDGLIFHRVINNFMIQGGDPSGTGRGGESIWGEPFEDEFKAEGRNIRGALSMANSGPNTNASQFFIVQAKEINQDTIDFLEKSAVSQQVIDLYREKGGTPHLDADIYEKAKHTVFAQVYEGMDVVDEIAAVKVGSGDKPVKDVVIETITIEKMK